MPTSRSLNNGFVNCSGIDGGVALAMSPTFVEQLGRMVCAIWLCQCCRTEGLYVVDGSMLQQPTGLYPLLPGEPPGKALVEPVAHGRSVLADG